MSAASIRRTAIRMTVHAALGSLAALALALPVAGSADALPEGRVYERVSPSFKGGYGAASILGVEPGGESVAFDARGVFAGLAGYSEGGSYQATRSASGWTTVSLAPPAGYSPHQGLTGFSPSLGASLWVASPGARNKDQAITALQFAAHPSGAPDTQAGFQPVGPLLQSINEGEEIAENTEYKGFSSDLCHAAVFTQHPLLPEAGMSDPITTNLYDVSAACGGEPASVRLVGLNSSGGLLSVACPTRLGAGEDTFNALSADGSEIFFEESGDPAVTEEIWCNNYAQLFVRVGGAKTLEVSKPLAECPGGEVPCVGAISRPPALFWGASEDGSRVFFTTAARLDPASDLDSGEDLYMAQIGCPGGVSGCAAAERVVSGLVQVSHDPQAGQAAEVQGVVGIAPDGERVYFVARGVLSEAPDGQGLAAVAGADNLYVYDAGTGQTAFIGDLCSGPEASGAIADTACPTGLEGGQGKHNDSELWRGQAFPSHTFAQASGGGGRFLVFSTYARLITGGPEADTDDARDVYRYDAQTGGLLRVSLGEDGYDANGNRDDGEQTVGEVAGEPVGAGDALVQPLVSYTIDQEERGGVRRAVSEDGSRIVLMSAEPLSPDATNGKVNVYEWHEGQVSLLSCGCATGGDTQPVITPSGRDVFFETNAGLLPGDSDGLPDIYDARLGGGFPAPPASAERCEGDACQGPLTNPAPLLVPGSVVQAPGENIPAPPASSTPSNKSTSSKSKRATSSKSKRKRKGCAGKPACRGSKRKRHATARRGAVKASATHGDRRRGR
jgi:hypothetical protein